MKKAKIFSFFENRKTDQRFHGRIVFFSAPFLNFLNFRVFLRLRVTVSVLRKMAFSELFLFSGKFHKKMVFICSMEKLSLQESVVVFVSRGLHASGWVVDCGRAGGSWTARDCVCRVLRCVGRGLRASADCDWAGRGLRAIGWVIDCAHRVDRGLRAIG